MTAIKAAGGRVDDDGMQPIINLTDQRTADNRRLRDHLLAAQHADDPNPFEHLDWFQVD